MRFITALIMLLSQMAQAMPENRLNGHTWDVVKPLLTNPHIPFSQVQGQLSKTGIKELDSLWDNRVDIYHPSCPSRSCSIVSEFPSEHTNEHPFVIIPGFTGYRKMFIELVYDLIQRGYGPIYVIDLRGQGEAQYFLPTLDDFMRTYQTKVRSNFEMATQELPDTPNKKLTATAVEIVRERMLSMPIGRGDIQDFLLYNQDINFAMNHVVARNPGKKIVLHGHSSGGLALMLSVGQKPVKDAAWINQLSAILLETAMLRNYQSDNYLKENWLIPIAEILAEILPYFLGPQKNMYPDRSVPEYVGKATGIYSMENKISHSANRVTFSDGLRVWNGFETAGATWGWAKATVNAHYDTINPFWKLKELNKSLGQIESNLRSSGSTVVAVTSDVDLFAVPDATRDVIKRLVRNGVKAYECRFENARHGIHQEADRFRTPYVNLAADLLGEPQVKPMYGAVYGEEPLPCNNFLKRN